IARRPANVRRSGHSLPTPSPGDSSHADSRTRGSRMGPRPLRYVAAVLALAAVYFAAAKLGLRMALDVQEVSPVWPPTGIALAAILLFGFRVWPGIALGAFLANLTLGEPFGTVLGITAGNTLEALAGAWLLNRFVGFDRRMVRLVDAIGLVVLAAGV